MSSVFFRIASRLFFNSSKKLPSIKGIRTCQMALLGTATTVMSDVKKKEMMEMKLDFDGLLDVRDACQKNDDSLRELMAVLCECVKELSQEYQTNIKKQIEIIDKCTKMGPVGEHWDALTEYRVLANELRQELTKYEVLVQKVGQMAYNQAVTSLLSGIENAMDLLEIDYNNLEKTVNQLSMENNKWETKLLYANRDSILHPIK